MNYTNAAGQSFYLPERELEPDDCYSEECGPTEDELEEERKDDILFFIRTHPRLVAEYVRDYYEEEHVKQFVDELSEYYYEEIQGHL